MEGSRFGRGSGKILIYGKIGNIRPAGCVWTRQGHRSPPARLIPALPKAGNSLGRSEGALTSRWIHRELKAGRNGSDPDTARERWDSYPAVSVAPCLLRCPGSRLTGREPLPGFPRNLEAAKEALPWENESGSQHSRLFPFILLPLDRGSGSRGRLCSRG